MTTDIIDRLKLWADFINDKQIRSVTEIGVWKGEFAQHLLDNCPTLERYYLVDPWAHLDHWDKPWNVSASEFEAVFQEAQRRVAPFAFKCTFLRGRTTEVELPEVDFTYVDGDHTLRGISIDLIRAWPKTKWLGGDDFDQVWQHGKDHEPSLVNPFAAYFAEAVGADFQLWGTQYLLSRDAPYQMDKPRRLLDSVAPRKRYFIG